MAASSNWKLRGPVGKRQIQSYAGQVASPDEHVGGASAAAASAAIAAATAELVVSLNVSGNRSTTPDVSRAALEELGRVRAELLQAADRDEQVLERLMDAYKKKSENLPDLLDEAAETTLYIAGLACRITEIAESEAPHASRFTVSDLGAAAALAHGAVTASLLTARININLLARAGGDVETRASELASRAEQIEQASFAACDVALAVANARIGPTAGTSR